jgi:hypothetical protein
LIDIFHGSICINDYTNLNSFALGSQDIYIVINIDGRSYRQSCSGNCSRGCCRTTRATLNHPGHPSRLAAVALVVPLFHRNFVTAGGLFGIVAESQPALLYSCRELDAK